MLRVEGFLPTALSYPKQVFLRARSGCPTTSALLYCRTARVVSSFLQLFWSFFLLPCRHFQVGAMGHLLLEKLQRRRPIDTVILCRLGCQVYLRVCIKRSSVSFFWLPALLNRLRAISVTFSSHFLPGFFSMSSIFLPTVAIRPRIFLLVFFFCLCLFPFRFYSSVVNIACVGAPRPNLSLRRGAVLFRGEWSFPIFPFLLLLLSPVYFDSCEAVMDPPMCSGTCSRSSMWWSTGGGTGAGGSFFFER